MDVRRLVAVVLGTGLMVVAACGGGGGGGGYPRLRHPGEVHHRVRVGSPRW